MTDKWDDDIAALNLTDFEKNGLQMYRNYKHAFEKHAEKIFADEVRTEGFDTTRLERVLAQTVEEDVRFLPVIACAYVDELLEAMFKKQIPDGVPGGKSAFLSQYGPLSSLAKRLQLAYAFDLLSQDLVCDLNRIRKARNDVAHAWDIQIFDNFFEAGAISQIFPVETILSEGPNKCIEVGESIDPQNAFRIRLAWILARVAYETAYYSRAKRAGLNPIRVLFENNGLEPLATVSTLVRRETKRIIETSHQIKVAKSP